MEVSQSIPTVVSFLWDSVTMKTGYVLYEHDNIKGGYCWVEFLVLVLLGYRPFMVH